MEYPVPDPIKPRPLGQGEGHLRCVTGDVRQEHVVEGVKASGTIAAAINREFRRMHTTYDIDVEDGYEEKIPFRSYSYNPPKIRNIYIMILNNEYYIEKR